MKSTVLTLIAVLGLCTGLPSLAAKTAVASKAASGVGIDCGKGIPCPNATRGSGGDSIVPKPDQLKPGQVSQQVKQTPAKAKKVQLDKAATAPAN